MGKKITILFILICGCANPLVSVKEELHQKSNLTESARATSDSHINASFPPAASVTVTASGNSSPRVTVSPSGDRVDFQQGEKKTAKENSKSTFSVDAFIESVPQWVWPCILFLMIVLILTIKNFLQKTMIGKALDASLGSAITAYAKVIKIGDMRLKRMTPNTPEYDAIKNLIEEVADLENIVSKKTRGHHN